MSTHTYLRAGGVWATNTALLSTEMAAFDAAQFDSVSASGGVYAPAAQIEIGGSGLKLTGTGHQISGTVHALTGSTVTFDSGCNLSIACNWSSSGAPTINGNATFGGTILANNTATFTAAVNFNGNVTLGDTSADLISIPGNFVSSGPAAFTGNLNIGDASSDLLVVASSSTFNAAATFSKPIVLSSTGRVRERVTQPGDADATISCETADVYFIPAGGISVDRNWTISDTNCSDGDHVLLINRSTTFFINVKNPGGATIVSLKSATGNPTTARVSRIGGVWVLSGDGKF